MKLKKTFFITTIFILLTIPQKLFSESFFSANAGGRLNYSSDSDSPQYDPQLFAEAFLETQFNISDNLWTHFNFSLKTNDFLDKQLFTAIDSDFKIDEISIIANSKSNKFMNYFGAYIGSFDAVGSDLFFQRYFGQQQIASKLTEIWLGKAGTILYPHFGIGISDVIKSNNSPSALGLYIYVNNTDTYNFVLNTDFRYACAYRYLSFDLAAGVGLPFSNTITGIDSIFLLDKLNWHAGATLLIGNNYTQSLFIQGGIANAKFSNQVGDIISSAEDFYILVEPRFKIGSTKLNITAYSLPKKTAEQLLFIKDTLGCNINIYNDALAAGTKKLCFGTNFALSYKDKTFMDILNLKDDTLAMNFNTFVTPYFSMNIFGGEMHTQLTLEIMDFFRNNWENAFSLDLGFRTTF